MLLVADPLFKLYASVTLCQPLEDLIERIRPVQLLSRLLSPNNP